MDSRSIKKHLKDGYEHLGFDVVSETEHGDTLLRYPEPGALDVTLRLTTEDIEEYSHLYAMRHQFQRKPNPTAMLNVNFREQLLIPLAGAIHPQDIQLVLPKPTANGMYVEIGHASPVFCNFMRFDQGYGNLCIDRLFELSPRTRQASRKKPLDARTIFADPLTIRVFQINASTPQEALERSDEWIDRTLFTLAYEFNIPLALASDWSPSRVERLRLIHRKDHQAGKLFAPDARFRSDLVRLYQAGIAADLPSHQFLAWFQILELFFQEVDHAGVYERLSAALSAPDFSTQPAHLARIVQIVESNRKEATPYLRLMQMIRQHAPAEDAEPSAHHLLILRDAIVNDGTLPANPDSIVKALPLVRRLAEAVILATRSY